MKKCILCGEELYDEPLLKLDNVPASAQDIPTKEELCTETGISLSLCQCKGCGLVQLDAEPVSYYKDVIRAGGFTQTMIRLREEQYASLISKYNLKGKKIVEVGAGRGEFLAPLAKFDVRAYGIEHKESLVKIARENGLEVEHGFAQNKEYKMPNAPFDAFLSFNFLEHQPKPNDMLQCIYSNLAEDGVGIITVPSWEYIVEHNGFYELIRDHLAYYTFETLTFAAEKNGFEVLEQKLINRDTLSVVVKKRKRAQVDALKENFELLSAGIDEYIASNEKQNKKIAVWGAGHQGFTICACTKLREHVRYIIDSAPFKQGKYAPASHIPIVSPKYFETCPVDSILIVAPGYTDEIADIIEKQYGSHVEIMVLKSKQLECRNANKRSL
ncbi:MAG: class I SAM-dependent methyltransferase [Christensenella sp.]